MKEKWFGLTRFRRLLILFQGALLLLFLLLYPLWADKEGVELHGTFYEKTVQGDTVTYQGKAGGFRTVYTVPRSGGECTVECRIEEEVFGPYTVSPDPEAAGDTGSWDGPVTGGVQVRRGEELLYRGAYYVGADGALLWFKGGSALYWGGGVTTVTGYSTPATIQEPEVDDILRFALGPNLVHRGDLLFFWLLLLIALLNSASILYADELFRWDLSFRIRDAEWAEPSDWELGSRYVGWCLLCAVEVGILIHGLTIVQ